MTDPRIVEHARILAEYSTKVKVGDMVYITADLDAHPLAVEVVKQVVRRGGVPLVIMDSSDLLRGLYDAASDDVLDMLPRHTFEAVKTSDVIIRLSAPSNTRALAGLDPKRVMRRQKANRPVSDEILKKRWCLTVHPCTGLAQEAKMSLSDYQDFVYGATLLDWQKEAALMLKLKAKLEQYKTIRYVGSDTDLSASTQDRTWVASVADKNLPSGEVFTSPVETSTEGRIYFDIPFLYAGTEIQGVRLQFRKGKVVKFSAERGQAALDALLGVDEGARRLGEMAIGTNRGIKRYTLNMLFDEKIGDTVHCALGNAYPECRGTNQSAVHVDMIKSMKEEGTILAGEDVVYEKGRYFWEK